MWNYDVSAAANRAETREILEASAQYVAAGRLEQEASSGQFSLERYLSQSAFNAQQGVGHALKSHQQESDLVESRQAVKDAAAERLESFTAARRATPPAQEGSPMGDVRQPLAPVGASPPAEQVKPSVTPPTAARGETNAAEASVHAVTDRGDSHASVGILAGKGDARDGFAPSMASGTQNAPKQTPVMSFSFFTQHENPRDRLRGQAFACDDEAATLAAARPRCGAIVETPAADFKDVALQETFMSRLQEIITRLCAMGQSWARVVVPVDAQTKVIVRFNTRNGRVKIHMSTDNQGLVELIRAGWKILTDGAAQNGISVDDPTFDNSIHDN